MFAKIFQENITTNNQQDITFIRSFNGAKVKLSDTNLIFEKDGIIHNYMLEKVEEDITTISFYTHLDNGTKVRVIRPHDKTLPLWVRDSGALGAFSIGSISSTGYGIYFHIVDVFSDLEVPGSFGRKEHIQKLIDNAIVAGENGLDDAFRKITSSLLILVKDNPQELLQHQKAQKLIGMIEKI